MQVQVCGLNLMFWFSASPKVRSRTEPKTVRNMRERTHGGALFVEDIREMSPLQSKTISLIISISNS